MSDYTYKLDMAGFLWEIHSPLELSARENCAPFLTDRPGADVTLRFRLERPADRGTLVHEKSPRVWQEPGALRIERLPAAATKACACVWLREDDPLSVEGCIYPDRTGAIASLDNLLDASELELLLTRLGVFGLHSSLVRRREGDAASVHPAGQAARRQRQNARREREIGEKVVL